MTNCVNLIGLLSHRCKNFFVVNCDGVFIKCVGADVTYIPLFSFVEIKGFLVNTVQGYVNRTAVYVEALAVVT